MPVATYDWNVLMEHCQGLLADMSGGQAEAPQRDARGRFAHGNAGGPGRPPKPGLIDDDVVSLVAHCVDEVNWLAIATQAVCQACQGDSAARNWLTRVLFGRHAGNLARIREARTAEEQQLAQQEAAPRGEAPAAASAPANSCAAPSPAAAAFPPAATSQPACTAPVPAGAVPAEEPAPSRWARAAAQRRRNEPFRLPLASERIVGFRVTKCSAETVNNGRNPANSASAAGLASVL